jgi:hypothetical protein
MVKASADCDSDALPFVGAVLTVPQYAAVGIGQPAGSDRRE